MADERRRLPDRSVVASLADGLVHGIHPLKELAELEREMKALAQSP